MTHFIVTMFNFQALLLKKKFMLYFSLLFIQTSVYSYFQAPTREWHSDARSHGILWTFFSDFAVSTLCVYVIDYFICNHMLQFSVAVSLHLMFQRPKLAKDQQHLSGSFCWT